MSRPGRRRWRSTSTPAGLAEQVQVGEGDVEHKFVGEVRDLHLSVVRDPPDVLRDPLLLRDPPTGLRLRLGLRTVRLNCDATPPTSLGRGSALCWVSNQPALSDPKLYRV